MTTRVPMSSNLKMRIAAHEQLHQEACRPEISRSHRGRKKSTTVLSVGQEADTVPSGQCG
jgi:putative transposase